MRWRITPNSLADKFTSSILSNLEMSEAQTSRKRPIPVIPPPTKWSGCKIGSCDLLLLVTEWTKEWA